jgi:hypothetical protein
MDHTLFNIIGFIICWVLLGFLASQYGAESRQDDNRPD